MKQTTTTMLKPKIMYAWEKWYIMLGVCQILADSKKKKKKKNGGVAPQNVLLGRSYGGVMDFGFL